MGKQMKDFVFLLQQPPYLGPSDIDSHIIKAVEETMLIGSSVKEWCVFGG